MEEFCYKGQVIGFRLRRVARGSIPVTAGQEPLQLVTLKHPKGSYLKAHYHAPKPRTTSQLQECLIVKRGKIKIDLYGKDGVCFKKLFLKSGELFLLMGGGIGIHVLEDAEMFEVKNGPFVNDKVLIEEQS